MRFAFRFLVGALYNTGGGSPPASIPSAFSSAFSSGFA